MPAGKTPEMPPEEVWKRIAEFAARTQKIATDYLAQQAKSDNFQIPDPGVVGKTFLEAWFRLASEPGKLAEAQMELWRDLSLLWQAEAKRVLGEPAEPVAVPHKGDKRFADEAWDSEVAFDYMKQAYLISSRWLQRTMRRVDGMDPHKARMLDFYTRQFVDALAPSNFLLTNPAALRKTMETSGDNLVKGLDHMLADLERGHGRLSISMTDYDAFKLGENVAVSPGKVVWQNDLMQLIQYAPSTGKVFRRPLLIVPPWINKFYILDLRPKNSFIKWAVDQGHTVFVISWVNPDETLAHKEFEDYMVEGPIEAMNVIEKVTGERRVNLIGYCIGGTLTACTLAYLSAKRQAGRVASVTFFTALVDFSEVGELDVFIDEEQLRLLEEHMEQKGYLEGRHMAQVFNMMRDNDLIWSFVVNNYLLGKEPFPFDLLYWNADSTRMPMMMHSFYLRNMYHLNKVVEPGGISLRGVPIDLRKIKTPTYILSTREDHIAPWKSTYAATRLYSGPVRFVLSASGHIAGVVNPPSANKYCYWTNPELRPDPDAWFADAAETPGSWWPDWQEWVGKHAGAMVPARMPGGGVLPPLEDAPGSYVKVRAND